MKRQRFRSFLCILLSLLLMMGCLASCSSKQKDDITAHAVIKAWFAAFETADYEEMRPYCTVEFQEQFFHDGDVFGYATARLQEIGGQKIDAGSDSYLAYQVKVIVQTVEGSANYDEHHRIVETSFICILEKQPDGKWLISDLDL